MEHVGPCSNLLDFNRSTWTYVAQNSDEEKDATGALFTADVAGVSIIGLGQGRERPTLALSHTGAKIDITADGVLLHNFVIDATGDIETVHKKVVEAVARVGL